MRYSMEDHHRQDVAASCIFLATKTEECGRKLRRDVLPESKEVEQCQASILLTEEVLLDALCFDYVVESPHSKLVDLFDAHDGDTCFAHDSYRTILGLLYPPQIIAAACYVLAQRVVDGPNSFSLDARVSSSAPTASLPTPPSHKPPSPDASRFAIEHFSFTDAELASVAEALSILLEFYKSQDVEISHPHLKSVVPSPTTAPRIKLYCPPSQLAMGPGPSEDSAPGRTPTSSHGGRTPANKETSNVAG
ncbi:hypothetical protein B0H13DRAFT_1939256 [Mycena leptocephala]|nr:hypothetical protein B0H13DRAFT_1939256 [Mycena leptocephala]